MRHDSTPVAASRAHIVPSVPLPSTLAPMYAIPSATTAVPASSPAASKRQHDRSIRGIHRARRRPASAGDDTPDRLLNAGVCAGSCRGQRGSPTFGAICGRRSPPASPFAEPAYTAPSPTVGARWADHWLGRLPAARRPVGRVDRMQEPDAIEHVDDALIGIRPLERRLLGHEAPALFACRDIERVRARHRRSRRTRGRRRPRRCPAPRRSPGTASGARADPVGPSDPSPRCAASPLNACPAARDADDRWALEQPGFRRGPRLRPAPRGPVLRPTATATVVHAGVPASRPAPGQRAAGARRRARGTGGRRTVGRAPPDPRRPAVGPRTRRRSSVAPVVVTPEALAPAAEQGLRGRFGLVDGSRDLSHAQVVEIAKHEAARCSAGSRCSAASTASRCCHRLGGIWLDLPDDDPQPAPLLARQPPMVVGQQVAGDAADPGGDRERVRRSSSEP